ncbi:MAG: type I-C CRISPR-associated protein Cas5c [Methanomassiliicoccales archaeon]|nr:type I-C CRISPR-associated protein Cas5c [Methanomassiliicoccales archaeon]
MGYGIRLKVWGRYACFTRPEMKVERVSYDVMTPSAARAILEAVHWKPAIRWVIDRINVINPIVFESIVRNEVDTKIGNAEVKKAMSGKECRIGIHTMDHIVQRKSLVLKDVCYVIDAHFVMTCKAGPGDTEEKHYNMFLRRAKNGQCYYQPYLGCREFTAHFEPVEEDVQSLVRGEADLGFMLWDIDFSNGNEALFYRPIMRDGIIEVPDLIGGVR